MLISNIAITDALTKRIKQATLRGPPIRSKNLSVHDSLDNLCMTRNQEMTKDDKKLDSHSSDDGSNELLTRTEQVRNTKHDREQEGLPISPTLFLKMFHGDEHSNNNTQDTSPSKVLKPDLATAMTSSPTKLEIIVDTLATSSTTKVLIPQSATASYNKAPIFKKHDHSLSTMRFLNDRITHETEQQNCSKMERICPSHPTRSISQTWNSTLRGSNRQLEVMVFNLVEAAQLKHLQNLQRELQNLALYRFAGYIGLKKEAKSKKNRALQDLSAPVTSESPIHAFETTMIMSDTRRIIYV